MSTFIHDQKVLKLNFRETIKSRKGQYSSYGNTKVKEIFELDKILILED